MRRAGGGREGRRCRQGGGVTWVEKWIDGWLLCILLSQGYSLLENGVGISLSKID